MPRCPVCQHRPAPAPDHRTTRRSRAYRQTIPPAEAAPRILRAMQDAARRGQVRTIDEFTRNPTTRALVEQAMAQEITVNHNAEEKPWLA